MGSNPNGVEIVQNQMLPLCKAQRIKRFSKKNKEQKDVLQREIAKGLIDCLKVSFSLPFVMIKDDLIEAGQTFDLIAENYGIRKKTRFFISEVSYNFDPNGASCKICAVSSDAITKNQIKEFL
jgi:hypothetical protein